VTTFLCTSKYRKTFGLPETLPTVEQPECALGPWYANTLNVGAQRMLNYMSSPSLLSVIISLRDRHSAEQRFVRALRELLSALDVPERYVEVKVSCMGSFQYDRASDQSKLGSLRDQAYMARRDFDDGLSLAVINRRAAVTPCGPMAYKSPEYVAPMLLEQKVARESG
jgi:hypothetical protein